MISERDIVGPFTESLIRNYKENLEAIILFGGASRNSRLICQWSDVDMIVIWKDALKVDVVFLARLIRETENKFKVRLDVTQTTVEEITTLSPVMYNGMVINALKRREVGRVIYGSLPPIDISDEQEKRCALVYLNQMLFWQREYYTESLLTVDAEQRRKLLPQLIRRTFSIVRASLRLFDIYCHPYHDSLIELRRVFPDLNVDVLHELIAIRSNYQHYTCESDIDLILRIRNFNENYIKEVLYKYLKSSIVWEPLSKSSGITGSLPLSCFLDR